MGQDWNDIPNALVEELPPGWPIGWATEALGEPILVLATRLNRKPVSSPPWHVIQHQTAGTYCNHHRMWAMRLTPTDATFAGMLKLEEHWFRSNAGWGPTLDEVIAYRASLHRIFGDGFDCNRSYQNFNEAIYPIDCSIELLERICTDTLPPRFGDFFDDALSIAPALGSYERAELYVLGANSD